MDLIPYLNAHPLTFEAEALTVTMAKCRSCPNPASVITLVVAPNGEFLEHFATMADALVYLVSFAAQLVANGRPHGWEFAHALTTWVMLASSDTPMLPEIGRVH